MCWRVFRIVCATVSVVHVRDCRLFVDSLFRAVYNSCVGSDPYLSERNQASAPSSGGLSIFREVWL